MKKKIFCLLLVLILPLYLFTGCTLIKEEPKEEPVKQEEQSEEKEPTQENLMVVVDSFEINEMLCYILVHKETKVMYLLETDGDLFVLLDAYGNPLTYEGEL